MRVHARTRTHTRTHARTHTHRELVRYELTRFSEVEEIFFFRADLKLLKVVAFLMYSGSEFQTEGSK